MLQQGQIQVDSMRHSQLCGIGVPCISYQLNNIVKTLKCIVEAISIPSRGCQSKRKSKQNGTLHPNEHITHYEIEKSKFHFCSIALACKSDEAVRKQLVDNFDSLYVILALSKPDLSLCRNDDCVFFFVNSLHCLSCMLTNDYIRTIVESMPDSFLKTLEILSLVVTEVSNRVYCEGKKSDSENHVDDGRNNHMLELCVIAMHVGCTAYSCVKLEWKECALNYNASAMYKCLMSLVRNNINFSLRAKSQREEKYQDWILHVAVNTILQINEYIPIASVECDSNSNTIVHDVFLFFRDKSEVFVSDEPMVECIVSSETVKEELMRLILCLVITPLRGRSEMSINEKSTCISDWALHSLSSTVIGERVTMDSIYRTQLSLEYLTYAITIAKGNRKVPSKKKATNSAPLRSRGNQMPTKKERATARCESFSNSILKKIISSGALRNIFWLLVHNEESVQMSSYQLLCKVFGWSSETRQAIEKEGCVDFDKDSVLLMFGQSIIPIMLCVNQMIEEEKTSNLSLFFKHVTSILRRVVLFDLEKNVANIRDDDTKMTIFAGIFLLFSTATNNEEKELYRKRRSNIVDVVVNTLASSSDPSLVEKSMIFWESINVLLEHSDVDGISSGEIAGESRDNYPFSKSSNEPPSVILFGFNDDHTKLKIRMECPPLSDLRCLAPRLANQIECQLKQGRMDSNEKEEQLPVIYGASYQVMEKMLDDVSSFESSTREHIIDEMSITGDDDLSIHECVQLLELAHTYGASKLKKKYSVLCSIKMGPTNALTVLECAIKSDDTTLSKAAFSKVHQNMFTVLQNAKKSGELELLSTLIASFIEINEFPAKL